MALKCLVAPDLSGSQKLGKCFISSGALQEWIQPMSLSSFYGNEIIVVVI